MRRIPVVLALCAAAAVGVASVGSSAAAEQRNIVRTAATAGKFDTLVSLVKEAGLARTLRRDGPFTVFAPTDRAFSKVPDSTLAELAEDKEMLRAVLLYHVVDRKLPARRLVKRDSVETLNGQSLRIRERDGKVRVGGARVVTPDVAASNGVIHVINEVLIPR
jgi:uncharacterized surface protein with fasciclin (FAS1) repeats